MRYFNRIVIGFLAYGCGFDLCSLTPFAAMEHGVLNVTVPKAKVKMPDVKPIEIWVLFFTFA
ncbi:putative HSP20-like chaperone [Rosa chinensis]|uniref:Putative HSP20-like chaperone n=1 Tax=Rosa chinensis TaxID=74649 RepID=A0A2P6RV16_ROSCH|nr:putative HSP20-like chaperone [Rosa chinensis]